MAEESQLKERYEASMVLSGAGNAIGYNYGRWESEENGEHIHAEVKVRGGMEKLDAKYFPVNTDTVMHLATAEALVEVGEGASFPILYQVLLKHYMQGREAGVTTRNLYFKRNDQRNDDDWKIPFKQSAGGCGAAMRAMCIGLRFPEPEQEHLLINVSVESGRLTHHHPTSYLGSLAAALFTAYAVRGSPPVEAWGSSLLAVLGKAKQYVEKTGHCVQENLQQWGYFENAWRSYLNKRGILDGKSRPKFPKRYGAKERDRFYSSVSFGGTGGNSGHDAPMIAYDALLRAGNSWVELANHGFFHGGDSDTTAIIAAAWWGAQYGYRGVPHVNYLRLEYRDRLARVAQQLYELSRKPFKEETGESEEQVEEQVEGRGEGQVEQVDGQVGEKVDEQGEEQVEEQGEEQVGEKVEEQAVVASR